MIKKILLGYKSILSSVFKILFLLFLCALTGAVFVFPLWYFASKLPQTYTLCMLAAVLFCAVFFTVSKIRKSGMKSILIFLLKLFTVALTLFLSVYLILNGKRLFTVPVIIAALFVWGLISFVFRNEQIKQEESFAED